MPGQPSASSTTNYTFDVTSLVVSESGSTQPPSNIVDQTDMMTFTANCNFAGSGAPGIVNLLAAAGARLQMLVKVEGWGTEPEMSVAPAFTALVPGQLSYQVHQTLPASSLSEGLYEIKAAVTLTPSAPSASPVTTRSRPYRSLPRRPESALRRPLGGRRPDRPGSTEGRCDAAAGHAAAHPP